VDDAAIIAKAPYARNTANKLPNLSWLSPNKVIIVENNCIINNGSMV